MAQSINVTIAERTFPLKVNSPEHEELIRKAAAEINRKVKFYLEKFPSKSPHEVMALVALNTGIALEGLKKDMLVEKAIKFVRDNAKVTTARKPRAKKEEAKDAE